MRSLDTVSSSTKCVIPQGISSGELLCQGSLVSDMCSGDLVERLTGVAVLFNCLEGGGCERAGFNKV